MLTYEELSEGKTALWDLFCAYSEEIDVIKKKLSNNNISPVKRQRLQSRLRDLRNRLIPDVASKLDGVGFLANYFLIVEAERSSKEGDYAII